MTRTPRVINSLHDHADSLRSRVSGQVSGKKLAYLGTGLALAGVGAGATAGFVEATSGTAAASQPAISRTAAQAGARERLTSSHQVKTGSAKTGRAKTKHNKVAHAPASHRRGHAKYELRRPTEHLKAWLAIERTVAGDKKPVAGYEQLPAADRLTPVGTSGPQTWMPMTAERYANAETIVKQALAKKMGLRSAVIAVATAMQESTLLNINYGDRDSLGLFQQRPSCGWGSSDQILHPAYAADAFLTALHTYQDKDPGWADQPLWQSAQGVQASGFPTAYAKWEAQAAHLVSQVTRQMY